MDNVEVALTKTLTINYGGSEYVFKLPSVNDRIVIAAKAARLRREVDPDGSIQLGYDPAIVLLTNKIASFMELLDSTNATWVYSPNEKGKSVMNPKKWPDNIPVMEVMDEFEAELARFRDEGDKQEQPTG